MIVARMGNGPILGASTLTNFPLAVPVANPCGNAATCSMYDMYSSLFEKDGNTVGVSPTGVVDSEDADNDDDDDDVTAAFWNGICSFVVVVVERWFDPSTNANVGVVMVATIHVDTGSSTMDSIGKEVIVYFIF